MKTQFEKEPYFQTFLRPSIELSLLLMIWNAFRYDDSWCWDVAVLFWTRGFVCLPWFPNRVSNSTMGLILKCLIPSFLLLVYVLNHFFSNLWIQICRLRFCWVQFILHKVLSTKGLRQMLCCSHIKIWNLANHMEKKWNNEHQTLGFQFSTNISNLLMSQAFGARFLYWIYFTI